MITIIDDQGVKLNHQAMEILAECEDEKSCQCYRGEARRGEARRDETRLFPVSAHTRGEQYKESDCFLSVYRSSIGILLLQLRIDKDLE